MRDPSPSSSSLSHPWAFDVFLSFRGEDTRYKFVGHLYQALCERGIRAFIDDQELKKGKDILDSLPEAIDKSRILIIIFSKNYASSAWCLDELVKIYECMETKGQLVWPIFYDVDPSEVRNQTGGFGIAMAEHKNNPLREPEKIQKWKSILTKAANLSGWHFKSGYESKFIHKIIKQVTKILNQVQLHVADHLVGLKFHISHLKSLLDIDSGGIRMIGIYGSGGIGKTTISQVLYNSIADEFDGASFVADVREYSTRLAQLQEKLLVEITDDNDIKVANVNKGILIIQRRLGSMKVLLILDDVTKLKDLQMLAGDKKWFGPGSWIIVTTRDQDLLIAHGIELRYEMEELSPDEALELLCWHAFKNGKPKVNFEELAKQAARYAKGLPLALEVIGCNLYDKEPDEWTYELDKYEKIPEGKIQRTLRISYDDLDRNEKQIFLDLACFFKGEGLNYVENVLDACGLYPKHGIRRLVGKSLIKIEDNIVKMHDLIQKMGREIVRESSPDLGKCGRLWFHEDVLNVLTTNTGTKKIGGIMLDLPQRKEVQWSGNAFEKMPNLRILIVRNAVFSTGPTHLPNTLRLLDWTEYPSTSLPENFHPRKLVALNLPNSRLRLDTSLPELKQLTRINFTRCEQLTEIPDMSAIPNLTVLQLDYCDKLVKIHDSVGFLCKLTILRAEHCTMLERLPSEIILPSLRSLSLHNCSRLQRLPDVLDKMENIITVNINLTAVQEFPSSMGNLVGLKNLFAFGCTSLSNLPCTMVMLTNLEYIAMQNCPKLFQNCKSHCDAGKLTSSSAELKLDLTQSHLSDKDLPVIVGCFPGIVVLVLSRNNFINISACLKELSHLKVLHLDDCEQLQEIQGVPPNLAVISAKNCKALSTQSAWDVFLAVKAEIVMPSNMVRKWFPYYYEGGSMSFWVRKKFPMLDISVSFKIPTYQRWLSYHFYVFLNDFLLFKAREEFIDVKGNHSRVLQLNSYIHATYSLRAWEHRNKWFNQVDEILHEGWNHVKISWEVAITKEVTADCCGVYVNWEEVSVHDILFEKPGAENACGCAECGQKDKDWERTTQDHVVSSEDELEKTCHSVIFETFGGKTREEGVKSSKICLDPSTEAEEESLFNRIHERPSELKGKLKEDENLLMASTFAASTNRNTGGVKLTESKHNQAHASYTQLHENRVDHIDSTMNEDNMKAFYDSLEAEISTLALPQNTTANNDCLTNGPSEKTRKALRDFKDFVSNKFYLLLDPVAAGLMKNTMEYLLSLSPEDGVSLRTTSVIMQLSRSFHQWTTEYKDADLKLGSATSDLAKVGKLEKGLEINLTEFREFETLENGSCNELADLEEKKRELEEEINKIRAEMEGLKDIRDAAGERKREVYENGRRLKAERDGLRNRVPRLKAEQEWANKTQENIEIEWSKLAELLVQSTGFQ